MKKRFTGIMMMVIYFASAGTLWADLGLSFQAMGGYVMDRGRTEQSVRDNSEFIIESAVEAGAGFPPEKVDIFTNMQVFDFALFADYILWKNIFLRSGIEYALSAGDFESYGEFDNGGNFGDYTITHKYEYIGVPLILGLIIPINYGRHNVYMGLGPCYNFVSIEQEGEGTGVMWTNYSHENMYKADGIGAIAIIGLNTKIYHRLSVSIEYTYHDFSEEKEDEIEVKDEFGTILGGFPAKQKYILAAPKTSIRLGVRYSI